MKYQVRTSVVNGIVKRNRQTFLDILRSFEGKDVLITFEKPTKKRSNPQNAYYHGVLIPITRDAIKTEWGELWSAEKTHEFLKGEFLFTEKVDESTGKIFRIPKSTTENSTTQQEDYHSEIRMWLKEFFNVECPLPNEQVSILIE